MTPELVERERELAALAALLEAAPAARGAWPGSRARPGSARARCSPRRGGAPASSGAHVLARARVRARARVPVRRGAPAVRGRCVADPERRDAAARRRRGAGARPVFGAPEAASGDASFAALHGLFWVALNLAAERPLVLAIDDLHWCDRPSLRFVAYLARRLEGLPILVAATLRTGEPGDRRGAARRDRARPVDGRRPPGAAQRRGACARSSASGSARTPTTPFCAACHQATGGNPLLLRQLLTALEADHVRPDAAHAGVVLEIGPRAVSRTVLLRLARLSADAIAVARAVAVLGESATLPTVAALDRARARRAWPTRPARSRGRDPAPRARRSGSSTRSCATRSTTSCRSASASCSTRAPRACCSTRARRPSRSRAHLLHRAAPRPGVGRRAAARGGPRRRRARRAGERASPTSAGRSRSRRRPRCGRELLLRARPRRGADGRPAAVGHLTRGLRGARATRGARALAAHALCRAAAVHRVTRPRRAGVRPARRARAAGRSWTTMRRAARGVRPT